MLHQAEAQAPNTSLAEAKTAAREGIEALETQLKEVLEKLEAIKSQAEADSARPDVPSPDARSRWPRRLPKIWKSWLVPQRTRPLCPVAPGGQQHHQPLYQSPVWQELRSYQAVNFIEHAQMRTGVLPSPPSESCRQVRGSSGMEVNSSLSSQLKCHGQTSGAGAWPLTDRRVST